MRYTNRCIHYFTYCAKRATDAMATGASEMAYVTAAVTNGENYH